ncbi:Ig-like domain-containing protein [Algoriphagus yeomjeoni]|uniref:Ig-like domain-containing protein n=1 Tax=Algoriphagus yeomjeoni TaxID=291403 RepID=UPI003CE56815
MMIELIKIRLCGLRNLIFFVVLFQFSCTNETEEAISIVWENDRAVALQLEKLSIYELGNSQIEVRLVQEGNRVPILGELKEEGGMIIFSPLIPFTRGQSYAIFNGDKKLGDVLIPNLDSNESDLSLIEIYPTQDSVPENLLKLFLKFSKPMREGQSVNYLTLIKGDTDTLSGVFLDLQPELWNDDQTMLTVWLDPGRIKRDLIPNQKMGAPLSKSEKYRLIISSDWKGLNGGVLDRDYSKDFVVVARDSISPAPLEWQLEIPRSGPKSPLKVKFEESLDFSLLNEVFKIISHENQETAGEWTIGIEEKSIEFTPDSNWNKGKYQVRISSRLEDLAGNNLNRLFETDLEIQTSEQEGAEFQFIEFEVKE